MYTPQRGSIIPVTMAASAILSLVTSVGFFLTSLSTTTPIANMYLTPRAAVVSVDNTFTTSVEVTAEAPVNTFSGMITFNPNRLRVVSIDYNTSIADLWTEEPWYQNGDGTIKYAGGTTRSGGFVGTGSLITVTFAALASGDAEVRMQDLHIYRHDGYGTDAPLYPTTATEFVVVSSTPVTLAATEAESVIVIRDTNLSGDLNNDGRVSIADVSIFFAHLTVQNKNSDLNNDGRVSMADLSILMSQM